jgi:hypothetical protein
LNESRVERKRAVAIRRCPDWPAELRHVTAKLGVEIGNRDAFDGKSRRHRSDRP